ncbi:Uncharacterised protein [Vibrio cholerae]|nr:Uncharacterised protein [Vibrio cholerae]
MSRFCSANAEQPRRHKGIDFGRIEIAVMKA